MPTTASALLQEIDRLLGALGVERSRLAGDLVARTPIDGGVTAHVMQATAPQAIAAIEAAHEAFLRWRLLQAPDDL
jgi:aldehyde dehydrogenase (NAD+)